MRVCGRIRSESGCVRAKPESLWPGQFRAGLPLPGGRVNLSAEASRTIDSGFAIAAATTDCCAGPEESSALRHVGHEERKRQILLLHDFELSVRGNADYRVRVRCRIVAKSSADNNRPRAPERRNSRPEFAGTRRSQLETSIGQVQAQEVASAQFDFPVVRP